MSDINSIRNFSIIAHIDHGKSTLADRILEATGAIESRDSRPQLLDNMDIEQERGITIKARSVRLNYTAKDGNKYIFNLIDTPGHVDFNYEVSRSLASCEGAILIVDSSQGVEAQTIANTYLALEHNLEILPVLNKIDLPNSRPEEAKEEIEHIIGLDTTDIPLISAKNGIGIEEVLEQIIKVIPPPIGDNTAPLKALIFDSYFDSYKGVIIYCRVFDGIVKKGDKIKLMATDKEYEVVEVGYLSPLEHIPQEEISAGEVGYITASIKDVSSARVGDTITNAKGGIDKPLSGYKDVQPMVYCGIYPADGAQYALLRDSLEKLKLNDASLYYEAENSVALGFGFRCGFLGLLHMEIIQERLEREYDLNIITTAPSVIYKIHKTDGTVLNIDNPTNLPPATEIDYMEEPIVLAEIYTPSDYIGTIMELCQERRGEHIGVEYIDKTRAEVKYYLPLNEIIYDFFDQLKSRTRGYASFDYDIHSYKKSSLVKLDILINNEVCDALSLIVHGSNSYARGRKIAEKLKEAIPRQLFEVPIQAAIGNKIIARETVKAMRKDVLAKCYGGDISRKRKLLEKQKEGKKRMRKVGSVEIPQDAFMSVLKLD